ncbi:hypothetical protein CS542_09325 [Pedobacter sp. IW39]|nr:hypothetical protein CS542_09325 [Pedobacter sp. IW39]
MDIQKIDEAFKPYEGHLITYTTGFGEVPVSTLRFLDENSSMIKSVFQWKQNLGSHYAKAATRISDQFKLPILMQFELSGTMADIQNL